MNSDARALAKMFGALEITQEEQGRAADVVRQ
jgi:hypothetical protein